MNTPSTFSTGTGNADDSSRDLAGRKRSARRRGCCDTNIHIDAQGDVNIYNCATPNAPCQAPPSTCPPGFPPLGACLPVVPGAKHKLSRDYKLAKLAERVRVPSSLAAGALHMARRFLLGKTPASPLEDAVFATLGRMSRDILSCTVAAFDAVPPRQRNRLFAPSLLLLDSDQPLDEATLVGALAQEILQRVGVQVFDDPRAADEEQAGRIRVYEPQGEDFFSQLRICRVNDLRTANFIPPIDPGAFLPAEIQQDCQPQIVDGQPQVVCQVRTTDCPGHTLTIGAGTTVCMRVPDVAQGDGVVLEGVNYFSVDAKVRFLDKQTAAVVREVDAHVWGDLDTPVTEVVNGQTVLINDCRVHDRLTFEVPVDLAPAVYQIQVVVPNITGISALGSELVSNVEFINVILPATARFQVVTEQIIARKETSPAWLGSDEVGLHTMAFPMDLNFEPINPLQEQKFKDIQDDDFDSGTRRDITRMVFEHNQPILGMLLVVMGDEIDSQRFYDEEVTSQAEFFFEIVAAEAAAIAGAIAALKAAGISLLALGATGAWIAGIALVVMLGIDLIIALWAPADPIIRDSIALSVTDLANLTSANAPAPDPRTFETEDGIVVNVNKTIPPLKLPLEYHETREYVSDDEDSRYEITYRYNRVA
jgi:hypothetical protein